MNDLERLQRKIDRLNEKIRQKEPPVIGTVPDSTPLQDRSVPADWPFPTDGAETPSAPSPYGTVKLTCVGCGLVTVDAFVIPNTSAWYLCGRCF